MILWLKMQGWDATVLYSLNVFKYEFRVSYASYAKIHCIKHSKILEIIE